jgi:hypothetical protein
MSKLVFEARLSARCFSRVPVATGEKGRLVLVAEMPGSVPCEKGLSPANGHEAFFHEEAKLNIFDAGVEDFLRAFHDVHQARTELQ